MKHILTTAFLFFGLTAAIQAQCPTGSNKITTPNCYTKTQTFLDNAKFIDTVQITSGSPGAGKVLTSNAAGIATWQAPSSGVSIPQSQVSYGTGTGLTSDSLFTRDTNKRTVIAYKPDGTNRIFKLEFTDSLSYINEDGHDTTVWQPRAVLSYGLDSSSQMYSYSALQILDESKVDGSANKIVLGYQSEGGSYGMNYIVEPQFLRLKVRDSITTLKTDYDFYPNTWKMDDKSNSVTLYVNFLSNPLPGQVLTIDETGDSATWQSSSGGLIVDSVSTVSSSVGLDANKLNVIKASGPITALTLIFPASPVNGDVIRLKFTQSVASLTLDPNTKSIIGPITAATQGLYTQFTYDSSTGEWY